MSGVAKLARHLRFPQRCNCGCRSAGMWSCVAGWVVTDVSAESSPWISWLLKKSGKTSGTNHPPTQRLVPKDRKPQRNIRQQNRFNSRYSVAVQSLCYKLRAVHGSDTVQSGGWVLVFRRNILPTSSGYKIEAACSSARSLPAYHTTRIITRLTTM
jgi:hypothetical protein